MKNATLSKRDGGQSGQRAFTLIELLIVIAIIAILALIAIPNFLEAQVRAKVSRVKADMRSLAVGVEAYTVDYQRIPMGWYYIDDSESAKCVGYQVPIGNDFFEWVQARMTTPIAYLSTILMDPFLERGSVRQTSGGGAPVYTASNPNGEALHLYDYTCAAWRNNIAEQYSADKNQCFAMGYVWSLRSLGPTRSSYYNEEPYRQLVGKGSGTKVYDPTNGTMSRGHIIRTNKGEFRGAPGS